MKKTTTMHILALRSGSRIRSKYDAKTIAATLLHAAENGMAAAARKYGPSESTISTWATKAVRGGGFEGDGGVYSRAQTDGRADNALPRDAARMGRDRARRRDRNEIAFADGTSMFTRATRRQLIRAMELVEQGETRAEAGRQIGFAAETVYRIFNAQLARGGIVTADGVRRFEAPEPKRSSAPASGPSARYPRHMVEAWDDLKWFAGGDSSIHARPSDIEPHSGFGLVKKPRR